MRERLWAREREKKYKKKESLTPTNFLYGSSFSIVWSDGFSGRVESLTKGKRRRGKKILHYFLIVVSEGSNGTTTFGRMAFNRMAFGRIAFRKIAFRKIAFRKIAFRKIAFRRIV